MSAVRRLLERASGRSGASSAAHPLPLGGTALVVRALLLLAVISTLATAGCGGGSELRITNPGGGTTIELEFPPGKEWKHSLPTISGGFRPYEANLEDCPDWVRLLFPDTRFPDRRILAGIAPADARGQEHLCTYRVTEADPGFRPQRSVSYGLRLAVGSNGALTLPDVIEIGALSVGDFHKTALPTATGGIKPYEYEFICAGGPLPSGMSFAPSPPVLAGTPDARFRNSCTYTVTDSADPAESFSRVVQVEVTGDGLSLPTVPPISLTVSERHTEALPEATGGIKPYEYEFICAGGPLPSGMSFAPSPPVLAGTPDARFRNSCTYTVTDSADPAESFSRVVQVEVTGDGLSLPTVPPISLTVSERHTEALPEATGGIKPYEYEFICAGGPLPSGMSFAPSPPVLAGTPDARFRNSCTYTVTDSADPAESFSRVVQVEVTGDGLSLPTVPPISLTVSERHTEALPEATGGIKPYEYEFICAGGPLPSGMSFAPSPPVLAGTPDARFRNSCTYTVTDSADPAESFSRVVQVEVTGDGLSLPTVPPISLTVSERHTEALPEATGGIKPYEYEFICAGGPLPSGMSFAPSPPVLAGTPDARFRNSCTYSPQLRTVRTPPNHSRGSSRSR